MLCQIFPKRKVPKPDYFLLFIKNKMSYNIDVSNLFKVIYYLQQCYHEKQFINAKNKKGNILQ